jgi:hypothetical protein
MKVKTIKYRDHLKAFLRFKSAKNYKAFIQNLPKLTYTKEDYNFTMLNANPSLLAALVYHDLNSKRIFTKKEIEFAMHLVPKYQYAIAPHPNRNKVSIVNLTS